MSWSAGGTAELERLLEKRFSCRAYRSEQIAPETLDRLFAAAQRSASWCNTQPWLVTVTTGLATAAFAAALSAHVATADPSPHFPPPAEYRGIYKQRRQEAGYGLYDSVGINRHDRSARHIQLMQNYRFFGAPHVALISTDRAQGVYGAVDCGGYVSTLLLVAASLGIASVAQASVAMYGDFVSDYLELPEDRLVLCAVGLGYPDLSAEINQFRTSRAATADVVTVRD